MTVFWIVAALFLLGALLLTLPPLLRAMPVRDGGGANAAVYRDQLREAERDLADDLITPERFAQARAEIERRVLEDTTVAEPATTSRQPARGVALALGVLIPLGSVLTYLALGNPAAVAPPVAERLSKPGGDARHSVSTEQIEQMVTTLAERLKNEPANVEGWLMLGRSYTALGRYRDAAIAMRRANELAPRNPALLADLADVVAMAQGKRLAGEPARLVQQALDIDPRHTKSLALAGSIAFEAKDYAGARSHWERLVAVLPPDSPTLRSLRGSIAQAAALESGRPGTVAANAPATPAAPGVRLTGSIEISPDLAKSVGPGDTLFVFARAADGPRMPLAIQRLRASPPYEFALDDSMAMSPELRLSGFARVVVGARVSKSGNATPQSGDFVGQSGPVSPGASGVRVRIDQRQP